MSLELVIGSFVGSADTKRRLLWEVLLTVHESHCGYGFEQCGT